MKKFREGAGLKVKRTSELPIPAVQQELFEEKLSDSSKDSRIPREPKTE